MRDTVLLRLSGERDLCQIVIMGIADHMRDAGQCRDLFGRALSVTSRDNDLTIGIVTTNAANGGAGVLFSGGGNRAGIENDPFGLAWGIGPMEALVPELSLNGGTVRLSGPTAEIFYVKAGHATILAYIHLRMRNPLDPQRCASCVRGLNEA